MELIDFNKCEQNQRMYGGTAGRKIGICYQGANYILKFPGNLKQQQMKNVRLSYSNSPVCEYIGSKIYQLLGFDAHETLLGIRNEKVVVACRDFLEKGERLCEFEKIKVTFEPRFLDSNGNETNGAGVDLYEICMTLEEHPFLKDIPGIQEHFWDMFVVDALIGNTDRNNSNWGVIIQDDGTKKIAPVYDNGNCLNNKWDDQKMQETLDDSVKFIAESYNARRCVFELEMKRINPYHLIQSMEYPSCNRSIEKIVPRIEKAMTQIRQMIDEIPVLSEVQKNFYTNILKSRYENVLLPTYQKIIEEQQIARNNKKERRGR